MAEGQPIDPKNLQQNPEHASTPEWLQNLRSLPEYTNSEIIDMLPNELVFSDIDGTMTYKLTAEEKQLPPEEQQKIFDSHKEALNGVFNRLQSKKRPLIAVSGRALADIQRGQTGGSNFANEGLPAFPVCAEAVGTTIQVLQKDGTYKEDQGWNEYIKNVISFDRNHIYQNGCVPLVHKAAELSPSLNLKFQPRDSQANVQAWKDDPENAVGNKPQAVPQEKKISFNWDGSADQVPEVRKLFETMLQAPQVDRPLVKIVISHDGPLGNDRHRYNVDLVPVTKRDAIEYMGRKYGGGTMKKYEPGYDPTTDTAEDNKGAITIVAGDSGNDEDMILGAQAGIVVGGAKAELVNSINAVTSNGTDVEKRTKHFVLLNSRQGSDGNLLYIEPASSDPQASRSLNKAIHALELLDAVRSK